MGLDTQDLKSQIRAQARAELKRISREERQFASAQACDLLKRHKIWQDAGSILFYAPLPDELDLAPLLEEAISLGKTVALPRFSLEANAYVSCRLQKAQQPLAPGRFGIQEPGVDSPVLPLNQLDLVLVPGVAFDLSGRRLGRGHGFYDRLLASVRGTKCGVAFDQQIKADLPFEPHDACLNCILTPTRWLSFGQSSAVK